MLIEFLQVGHAIFKKWEPLKARIVIPLIAFPPATLSFLFVPHFGAIAGVCLAFATYLATLLASIVVYRLSPWHPLAKYPGPVSVKISKIAYTWAIRGGKRHTYIKSLHDRYGDIVRIGTSLVVVLRAVPTLTIPSTKRGVNPGRVLCGASPGTARPR